MKLLTLSLAAASSAICSLALADDMKVYGPNIEAGEKSVEVNTNTDFDKDKSKNHYLSQVYAADYAPNSHYMTELGAEFEKDPGTNANKMTNLKWENIISPWQKGENFVDSALYVEMEKGILKDSPNNLEIKGLFEKDIGNVVTIANPRINHEFGSNHGQDWQGGLSLLTKYRYSKEFEPGLEYYGDFGSLQHTTSLSEQDHRIGPVIQGKLGKVNYDVGAFAGMTKGAPDATAKLNLEYEF